MWGDTFSYNIINNPLTFLIIIFIAILFRSISNKKFYLPKKRFSTEMLVTILLLLVIPFFSLIILYSKDFINSSINDYKLKIFLNSFTLENLKLYFFVPILWFFLIGFTKNKLKFLFLFLITVYSGLSIFFHHHLTLPGIYFLELFFILWMILEFFDKKIKNINKIEIIIILILVNSTFMHSPSRIPNPLNLKINLSELSNFNEKPYICPNDINKIKNYQNVIESDLLSGLLNKRYFTELAYEKNYNSYEHYNLAVPLALSPKTNFKNPCKN